MHGLLNIHMPAYYDSIMKGVSTIMVSYSSWNGKKMHANNELITGFLKGTLKFKVFLETYYIFGMLVMFSIQLRRQFLGR